jgi:hypothetical protein
MREHTKTYLESFGYDVCDNIPSELSLNKAIDVNHILCKGMGGNPKKDKERIENYIAMTREEHVEYGDKKKYYSYLFRVHKAFMIQRGVKFDLNWIDLQIEKYSHYEDINNIPIL